MAVAQSRRDVADKAGEGKGAGSHKTFLAQSEEFELNPEASRQPIEHKVSKSIGGSHQNLKISQESSQPLHGECGRHIFCLQRANILELGE